MIDLQIIRPGRTIRVPFSSFDKDDGSSVTMTNFAVADILIYKDGSTTERASTSGFTATTDFDTKTGKHVIVIDLADNGTAGFFAAGSEYLLGIDAVTVDGVTVGGWVARFRIGYFNSIFDTTIAALTSQTVFTLTVGPAENDAIKGCTIIVHDIASAVQFALGVVASYVGSTKEVTLAAAPTFTVAAGDNFSCFFPMPLQPTVHGRPLDVSAGGEAGLDWANIGSPTTAQGLTNTTVKTATDVETDTQDIQSRLPAALVSGRIDASIGAVAAGVIAAASFASGALDAVWSVATRLLTAGTNIVLAKGTGVTGFNDPTAATTASAVRTELATELARVDVATSTRSSHNAADVWAAGTRTLTGFGTLVADVATAIWGAGTRLLTAGTNIVLAKGTGVTGFNDLDAAGVRGAVGLASNNLDTQLAAIAALAAAIDAKTTNLPSDPADQSLIIDATNALAVLINALNNLSAAQVATQVATQLGVYDGPTNAEMEARTLTAAQVAKQGAHLNGVLTFVADAGSTTTQLVLATVNGAVPSAVNDFYNGAVVVFTSGALAGQRTDITDYDGATKTATITATTSAAATGVVGVIV